MCNGNIRSINREACKWLEFFDARIGDQRGKPILIMLE